MALDFAYHFGYYPGYFRLGLSTSTVTNYIETKVYVLFYKQVVLEWTIPSKWGMCVFDIYKSNTEYGPFEKLTNTPINANIFIDTTTQAFSKFENDFYVIECQLPDGRRIVTKPITWINKRNNWAEIRSNEIQRRETLLLERYTGISTLVFRRRTFGKRCHRCWNTTINKVTEDKCPVCTGTSFEGGYFSGFKTVIQYDPTPNNKVFAQQGIIEPNVITAWTIAYPEINSLDLILRIPDWKMYRVEAVQTTELQAVPVRQILQLTELDKESIEFELAKQVIPEEYQ